MGMIKKYILEQLDLLDNITCKEMMGEFLLYYNNILFGGIYERYNTQDNMPIAKRNDYWGNKTIYVFRKENNEGYEFIGCYKQDEEKLEELFTKNIIKERPYKKIGSRIDLTKFN